jgi:predicted DCC family thiol-disulfide oxidoreductase YuxK
MPSSNATPTILTVLYDGSCTFCTTSAARVAHFDRRRQIELLDLHEPSVSQRFPQVDRDIAMRWMQAVDSRGQVFSGVDAWARIGQLLPGWNLVAWLLRVPGIHWLAAKIYGWIARNRYRWNRQLCADGSCALHVPDPPQPRNIP